MVYLPEHLPRPLRFSLGGLFRGDTLAQMLGRGSKPMAGPIEVWRRLALEGRWRSWRGDEVVFRRHGTGYVGTIAKLCPLLKECHFSVGEQTFTLTRRNEQGGIEGTCKWRSTNRTTQPWWRPVKITFKDENHIQDDNVGNWARVSATGG